MPVHLIFSALGQQESKGLLFFHAFSGCDSCSGMEGKGKKSFFSTWLVYPDVTPVFQKLSQCPEEISTNDFGIIQKFIIYLYDKSSNESKVDNARIVMFTQKNKEYNNIPPTEDALKMHALCAAYQSGYIWGQALLFQICHLRVTRDGNLQREAHETFCGQRKTPLLKLV